MMTREYLDAVKKRHNLKSDYQLAKLLESSTPVISRYRTGERVMDDYTAARVAELLQLNPLEVIAQANAEREKDEKKRKFWRKLSAAVMTTVVLFTTLVPKTQAESDVHSGDPSVIQIIALWIRRIAATWKRPELMHEDRKLCGA